MSRLATSKGRIADKSDILLSLSVHIRILNNYMTNINTAVKLVFLSHLESGENSFGILYKRNISKKSRVINGK